jgi:hypothetical protein
VNISFAIHDAKAIAINKVPTAQTVAMNPMFFSP